MAVLCDDIAKSLRMFWTTVHTVVPSKPRVSADSPLIDTKAIAQVLRRIAEDLWFTPRTVEDFKAGDFDFLSRAEQQRLSDCVGRFRKAASEQKRPAAESAFIGILNVLRFDKYVGSVESFVVGKKIEGRVSLPEWVEALRFEAGRDAGGDPCISIWIIAKDCVEKDSGMTANVQRLRNEIVEACHDLGIELWPYVWLRTQKEQTELDRRGVA